MNLKVLDLIYQSIISEGGDGDALWLSKHTSLEDLSEIIKEYNVNNKTRWDLIINDDHILWGLDQEWDIITNDVDLFNSQPKWIILKIDY